MELRPFRDGDAPACGAVFHRAVHEGAATHYTPEQRAAWAPFGAPPADVLQRFATRLAAQITWVADEDGRIEGFLSLGHDGYLDYTYVAPERMGTGLAAALYAQVEAEARAQGMTELSTEASHLARPFFARHGWQVEAAQEVERRGVLIPNFRMRKDL